MNLPLHNATTDGTTYSFREVSLVVSLDEEGFEVANEYLRVFGFGESLSEAVAEWAHVFHLNYTDLVDTDDALAPSGEEYARTLGAAVIA